MCVSETTHGVSLIVKIKVEMTFLRGAWVARSVKPPTLDFGSGCDLRVVRWSPVPGSALGVESA